MINSFLFNTISKQFACTCLESNLIQDTITQWYHLCATYDLDPEQVKNYVLRDIIIRLHHRNKIMEEQLNYTTTN